MLSGNYYLLISPDVSMWKPFLLPGSLQRTALVSIGSIQMKVCKVLHLLEFDRHFYRKILRWMLLY